MPDEVYLALAEAARANRQSLSAFVVERLTEVARVARLDDYVASYQPPAGSGVTLEHRHGGTRGARGDVSLAVVDASVLVAFYAADDPRRASVVSRLAVGDALFAPTNLDAEIVSALRGLSRPHPALRTAVPGALGHLARFPIRRMPLAPMLQRIWELRDYLTAYDAAYVTLAERLDGPLVTCDTTLAAASGPVCAVDLIT